MKFNQIKETGLYVGDLHRTEAFYRDKLELEVITKVEGRHIFFRAGSSVLLCFIADVTRDDTKVPHFGEGNMHIAFEVPKNDYQAAKSWIQSKGIAVEHEQQWSDNFFSFYFRDPDGHSLEIVPEGMWA